MSTSSFAIELPKHLLARARNGDVHAFEEIYRLFERPVYTLAWRLLNDADEAQETLHDAMLRLFQKLSQFRDEAPFWSWLRQIAVNEALMRLRRRRLIDYTDVLPELVDERTPAALLERHDLAQALAQLPAITRSVVWLFHVEGYSHQEIAQQFGKTESFSKSQLARGTQKLRGLLAPHPEGLAHVGYV
ncbi:MAG: RNA polymerase subunit sigma-24 [Lysobacterales bacterium CG02_land_8_20_14_3_00_62_12]|nr:MAG: RNA polymerase subunit sigma-24 [Xanthomonadales bacterium CG02_land_8_20_14_3_00_62_12]